MPKSSTAESMVVLILLYLFLVAGVMAELLPSVTQDAKLTRTDDGLTLQQPIGSNLTLGPVKTDDALPATPSESGPSGTKPSTGSAPASTSAEILASVTTPVPSTTHVHRGVAHHHRAPPGRTIVSISSRSQAAGERDSAVAKEPAEEPGAEPAGGDGVDASSRTIDTPIESAVDDDAMIVIAALVLLVGAGLLAGLLRSMAPPDEDETDEADSTPSGPAPADAIFADVSAALDAALRAREGASRADMTPKTDEQAARLQLLFTKACVEAREVGSRVRQVAARLSERGCPADQIERLEQLADEAGTVSEAPDKPHNLAKAIADAADRAAEAADAAAKAAMRWQPAKVPA